MLKTGFPFDAVQMPLNAFDANFPQLRTASFARTEQAWNRGAGNEATERPRRAIKHGVITAEEALALCDEPAGDDDHYRDR